MPRKKIRKEKTREYLEGLLESAGVGDKEIAQAISTGLKSDVANERIKALELAGKWKGFYDADKKLGNELEKLPISNISAVDFQALANKCTMCKHKFEPKRKTNEVKSEQIPKEAADTEQGG